MEPGFSFGDGWSKAADEQLVSDRNYNFTDCDSCAQGDFMAFV